MRWVSERSGVEAGAEGFLADDSWATGMGGDNTHGSSQGVDACNSAFTSTSA